MTAVDFRRAHLGSRTFSGASTALFEVRTGSASSPHQLADPIGANMGCLVGAARIVREIDQPDASDQLLERKGSELRHAAVGRIVPVIAQREEMTLRNRKNNSIVQKAVVEAIEDLVARAIR